MSIDILAVSGSPIKNSNTDRVLNEIIRASGLNAEFIKLSTVTVKPCRACKACANDNICKQKDDFPEIAEKLKQAKVLIIGSYTPYGMIDGHTKAFLERLWSMRHVTNLNKEKYIITVTTGLVRGIIKQTEKMIFMETVMEHSRMLKQLQVRGNVPCLTCGHGHYCDMSGAPMLFGTHKAATVENCQKVEDQPVWRKARSAGEMLGKLVRGEIEFNRKLYILKVLRFMLPKFFQFKAAARWHKRGQDTISSYSEDAAKSINR
ncbi:MAG: flavodoxin family protein [bacterium]|nr:flavodoxin family protein [bacterium]